MIMSWSPLTGTMWVLHDDDCFLCVIDGYIPLWGKQPEVGH